MDPSALIFVALAVAWAAYLIPKALEHHEEGERSRGIDAFSDRMRILARREPVGRRRTALVTVADAAPEPAAPAAPPPAPVVPVAPTAAQVRARRRAAARAARRRRRVLDVLLVANLAVAAAAILGYLAWHWQAVPGGLVVVWLVLCRWMKVRERRRLHAPVLQRLDLELTGPVPVVAQVAEIVDDIDPAALLDATQDIPVVPAEPAAPAAGGWDLQPFVIPTYVAKDQVRRSVRTIDLDSTGVWSSGRNDADSALVREARAEQPATPAAGGEVVPGAVPGVPDDVVRATGS